jgi:hypothetical protein
VEIDRLGQCGIIFSWWRSLVLPEGRWSVFWQDLQISWELGNWTTLADVFKSVLGGGGCLSWPGSTVDGWRWKYWTVLSCGCVGGTRALRWRNCLCLGSSKWTGKSLKDFKVGRGKAQASCKWIRLENAVWGPK